MSKHLKVTDKQTHRQPHKHIHRQTDRHTHTQTSRQTDTHTHTQYENIPTHLQAITKRTSNLIYFYECHIVQSTLKVAKRNINQFTLSFTSTTALFARCQLEHTRLYIKDIPVDKYCLPETFCRICTNIWNNSSVPLCRTFVFR